MNRRDFLKSLLVTGVVTTVMPEAHWVRPSRVFINEGASAQVTFTLPAAPTGLKYTFIIQDSRTINVDGGKQGMDYQIIEV